MSKLGQAFESLNDVCFTIDMQKKGFNIRSNFSKTDKDTNEYTRKQYVCYKKETHKRK